MGEILRHTCLNCGAQTELHVGGGMRDCEVATALQAGHGDRKLAAALQDGARFRINRVTAVCRRCQKLVAGTRVIYQREGISEEMVQGVCPVCSGQLEWPEEKKVSCPVCGGQTELTIIGHWD